MKTDQELLADGNVAVLRARYAHKVRVYIGRCLGKVTAPTCSILVSKIMGQVFDTLPKRLRPGGSVEALLYKLAARLAEHHLQVA